MRTAVSPFGQTFDTHHEMSGRLSHDWLLLLSLYLCSKNRQSRGLAATEDKNRHFLDFIVTCFRGFCLRKAAMMQRFCKRPVCARLKGKPSRGKRVCCRLPVPLSLEMTVAVQVAIRAYRLLVELFF